jgi:hypothetical protein
MSPLSRDLGENVNVSDIRKKIQDVAGVISISDVSIFNKVGGQYSSSETSQRYSDSSTKRIELIDDTIFAEPNQIYQIRYDSRDIKVRVKDLKTVDFK